MENEINPWPALWALMVGFFMILVDGTIVNIANPAIMRGLGLGSDYNAVIWVTSAYLLSSAVPLLVTGRLGDRFGPKRLYMTGLIIFTLSSAWCGASGMLPGGGVGMLIAARFVQGLGGSLMTPQSMAIITRTFPPDRRGSAMGLWGSVAGVATLVGPLLGGFLVDAFGWESIFFVNVPIGIVAFVLVWRLVPRLQTHPHRFDLPGVVLSMVGISLVVFGIQEGESYNWGTIAGPITVPGLIVTGLIVFAAFITWQALNKNEPLLPLELLRDRNFSLANTAISLVGFGVTCMSLPLIFYLQVARGLSPTQSALLLAPSSILGFFLAPVVGRLVDRVNPRNIAIFGLLVFFVGLVGYSRLINMDTPVLWLAVPNTVMGLGTAAIWSPLSTTATRNLPPHRAGAGAGLYNTTRQLGAVIGSASIAALIQLRLSINLPQIPSGAPSVRVTGALPAFLQPGFTQSMSEVMMLPAAAALLALITVLFFAKPAAPAWGPGAPMRD